MLKQPLQIIFFEYILFVAMISGKEQALLRALLTTLCVLTYMQHCFPCI